MRVGQIPKVASLRNKGHLNVDISHLTSSLVTVLLMCSREDKEQTGDLYPKTILKFQNDPFVFSHSKQGHCKQHNQTSGRGRVLRHDVTSPIGSMSRGFSFRENEKKKQLSTVFELKKKKRDFKSYGIKAPLSSFD